MVRYRYKINKLIDVGGKLLDNIYMPVIQEGKKLYRVYSHDFNNGFKLMEHSYIGNSFVNVVCNYIVDNAVKLWWCGDYAKAEDFENEKEFKRIYDYAWKDEEDKEEGTTIPEPNTDFDWSKQWYFVNETKKEFVKMPVVKNEEYDWTYNCVSLLTAAGNGRGGGDYWREDMQSVVGCWAGDVVYLTLKKPDDKLFCDITEDTDFGKDE